LGDQAVKLFDVCFGFGLGFDSFLSASFRASFDANFGSIGIGSGRIDGQARTFFFLNGL
jgi:hypothetical protein